MLLSSWLDAARSAAGLYGKCHSPGAIVIAYTQHKQLINSFGWPCTAACACGLVWACLAEHRIKSAQPMARPAITLQARHVPVPAQTLHCCRLPLARRAACMAVLHYAVSCASLLQLLPRKAGAWLQLKSWLRQAAALLQLPPCCIPQQLPAADDTSIPASCCSLFARPGKAWHCTCRCTGSGAWRALTRGERGCKESRARRLR